MDDEMADGDHKAVLARITCFSFATGLALLVVSLCVANTSNAQDKGDSISLSERVAAIEQWAYPPAVRGPQSVGLIRWNHPVQFVVIAQDGEDASSAETVINDILAQLPQTIRSEVSIDHEIPTGNSNWYVDKAVIYLGSGPYAELNSSLRPVLNSLSNENSKNDELIASLISTNPPSHSTFAIKRPGTVTGYLVLIRSDLPAGVKRQGLAASVIAAIGPSITLGNAPGDQMFASKGAQLSPRALDYLRVMLSDATEPGMSLEKFDNAAQRVLSGM